MVPKGRMSRASRASRLPGGPHEIRERGSPPVTGGLPRRFGPRNVRTCIPAATAALGKATAYRIRLPMDEAERLFLREPLIRTHDVFQSLPLNPGGKGVLIAPFPHPGNAP